MTIRVGVVQLAPSASPAADFRRAVDGLPAFRGLADLVVLPDLSGRTSCGELPGGEPVGLLRGRAEDLGIAIVAAFSERSTGRGRLSTILVAPGGAHATYRWLHLAPHERQTHEAGSAPPPVLRLPAGRVGIMGSHDWLFPEVPRGLALAGAELIAHPMASPHAAAQSILSTRAFENGVFVASANLGGGPPACPSQVVAPDGEPLLRLHLGEGGAASGIVAIDPRRSWEKLGPDGIDLLGGRAPDLYALGRRFSIQRHARSPEDVHLDLFVEDAGRLAAIRLDDLPGEGGCIDGLRLDPHRLRYLDYEGETAGGGGRVDLVDRGVVATLDGTLDGAFALELRGWTLRLRLEVEPVGAGRVRVRRPSAQGPAAPSVA